MRPHSFGVSAIGVRGATLPGPRAGAWTTTYRAWSPPPGAGGQWPVSGGACGVVREPLGGNEGLYSQECRSQGRAQAAVREQERKGCVAGLKQRKEGVWLVVRLQCGERDKDIR